MNFPVPNLHPKPAPEPPAMVQAATREDVDQWNRRIFKAPPLEVHPQAFNATMFAQDLPRASLNGR
jgi:hypothetical protein